jgi:putative SOS response-associated peptidase YedK
MGADGSEIETAAIITTEPNPVVAQIHDRMPVVIHPDDYAKWLDVQNVDGKESVQMLTMAADDYFVFEPTTIERNTPPLKPKAQLTLF